MSDSATCILREPLPQNATVVTKRIKESYRFLWLLVLEGLVNELSCSRVVCEECFAKCNLHNVTL